MKKSPEEKAQSFMNVTFISPILLLTVPSIVIYFFEVNYNLFVVLNTLGLALATVRIALTAGISIVVKASLRGKVEGTAQKDKWVKESKLLLVIVIIAQLVNFMFIQQN